MKDSVDPARAPESVRSGGDPAGAELSMAALFTLVWDALADLLGTAATATLVRRAARRAAVRSPELADLAIERDNLDYHYTVPTAWQDEGGRTPLALRELMRELLPLLVELTGPVVVRHLAQIPELRAREIISPPEREEEKP
jgi:hypothetical protein